MAIYNNNQVLQVVRVVPASGGTAETTTYDNTTSGLEANNVQDGIDEVLSISQKLAEENDYTTSAIITANNLGLNILVVENFKNVDNIDQSLLDGAQVVANNWQPNKHALVFTQGHISFESTLFTVDDTPRQAWVNLDYFTDDDNVDVRVFISKNNGADWTNITPNTITNLNLLIQKQIRIRIDIEDLRGSLTLKNLAWGVM